MLQRKSQISFAQQACLLSSVFSSKLFSHSHAPLSDWSHFYLWHLKPQNLRVRRSQNFRPKGRSHQSDQDRSRVRNEQVMNRVSLTLYSTLRRNKRLLGRSFYREMKRKKKSRKWKGRNLEGTASYKGEAVHWKGVVLDYRMNRMRSSKIWGIVNNHKTEKERNVRFGFWEVESMLLESERSKSTNLTLQLWKDYLREALFPKRNLCLQRFMNNLPPFPWRLSQPFNTSLQCFSEMNH